MIRLYINWYQETDRQRRRELNTCIETNFRLPYIDEIINISDCKLNAEIKVRNILTDKRPTYQDYFDRINKDAKPKDISIIANLDIYFDVTVLLAAALRENECYALSRWEVNRDGSKNMKQVQTRGDSQDCWIFKGKVKPLAHADFLTGKLGCDNRIAHELVMAGYHVVNPSKSIMTWHVHASNHRVSSVVKKDIIPPPYHRIKPTAL